MNLKDLIAATLIGAIFQLTMIVVGHFVPFVRDNVFMIGGLAISLLAGLSYQLRARSSWAWAIVGGAVAGAACAAIGIAASVALKDTPQEILVLGTCGSAVTGLIGGLVGKLFTRTPASNALIS
jgi:hypothetical protein